MELFVSKIQRFSTADGPGIRTTVFLQGCNLHCLWCHNPETQPLSPQTLRFRGGITEISGIMRSVESVYEEIMRDESFYKASGGGITISGGEPLLQADGVRVLLEKLKKSGISTIIDTAGAVGFSAFQKVMPYTDLFYYDVKAGNENAYKHYVGGSFKLIAENLIKLIKNGGKARVRLPLISGVNTDKKSFESIAELMLTAGVGEIDILPYHKYGIAKYDALGTEYLMSKKRVTSANIIKRAQDFFIKKGFAVKIELH